jgi:lysozyme family protein
MSKLTQYPAIFEKAINKTLDHEGGYVNNPKDPGGETKFGISKRQYPQIDIKNMVREEAKALYFKDFWVGKPCSLIKNEEISIKLFDISINIGPSQANKSLQRALRSVGISTIIDDGLIGPKTISAIEMVDNHALLAAFRSEVAGYYRIITAIRKDNETFISGWLKRAYS